MPPNPSQSYRAKNEPAASGRTLFLQPYSFQKTEKQGFRKEKYHHE